jgi:hypothetical protein
MATETFGMKDKYLAGMAFVILLIIYVLLILKGVQTNFIENLTFSILGVLGALLKQSSSVPSTNLEIKSTGDTHVDNPTTTNNNN